MRSVIVSAPGAHIGDSRSMGRFLAQAVESLEARGCQVIIVSAKELAAAQQTNGFLRVLRRFRVPWLVIYWVFAFKIWRGAGYPIILPISQEWVLPFGFSKQIPIYHDLIQYFYPRNKKSAPYYRYYLPWASRKLGFVYCVTNSTGRMVRRIMGRVSYHICGVPIDKVFSSHTDESTADERFQAVWVGTLMAHKNYQRVLSYIESTAREEGNVAMVVLAEEATALDYEVGARGLGKRIKIFANLSEDELVSVYRRSKTVLSTSALEGFCMPVLEAALCGCVPVVPDRATFRENYSRFGVLVPPHDGAYGNYTKNAGAQFARPEVMARARALHEAVRERWSISMDEIAKAVKLGCKDYITRGPQQSS